MYAVLVVVNAKPRSSTTRSSGKSWATSGSPSRSPRRRPETLTWPSLERSTSTPQLAASAHIFECTAADSVILPLILPMLRICQVIHARGHILQMSPKCHPELAGHGIEYAWGAAKLRFRRDNDGSSGFANFFKRVRAALASVSLSLAF